MNGIMRPYPYLNWNLEVGLLCWQMEGGNAVTRLLKVSHDKCALGEGLCQCAVLH